MQYVDTAKGTGVGDDLGYPATVELDSGQFLTVWYELLKGLGARCVASGPLVHVAPSGTRDGRSCEEGCADVTWLTSAGAYSGLGNSRRGNISLRVAV